MTMTAAGFPRHIHRYRHSQAGCSADEIPQSIFDKTQLTYMVLRAFTGNFLDFCLTYFVWCYDYDYDYLFIYLFIETLENWQDIDSAAQK